MVSKQTTIKKIARELTANLLMLANANVFTQEEILAAMIQEAHRQYSGINENNALALIKVLDNYLQHKD